MPDVIESARTSIEDRLKEVEAEAARLRQALAGLNPGSANPSRSRERRTTSSTARRTRKAGQGVRAPRGQRQAEFLAAIEQKPGMKAPEIAREMGVATNQVYGLARRLQEAGRISKRRGGGYVPRVATKAA
jgi:predicted Rossmann fold nucleotide-binding protein DprA/Smf involved in DNA uptake